MKELYKGRASQVSQHHFFSSKVMSQGLCIHISVQHKKTYTTIEHFFYLF